MPEIKDMYDRNPSTKSITSITEITRRVVSIDFYRMIDTIDNVYVIDSYWFIERRFSDIDFIDCPGRADLEVPRKFVLGLLKLGNCQPGM